MTRVKCKVLHTFGPNKRGTVISLPLTVAQRYESKARPRVEILGGDGQEATAHTTHIGTFRKLNPGTPKHTTPDGESGDTKPEIVDAGRGWFNVEVGGEYVMRSDGLSPKKFRRADAEAYVKAL